jgi:hypothetical protein
MPRVAYCLYGQPRRLYEGHKYIMDFVRSNPDYIFDFYYHTWYVKPENGEVYEAAQWRNLSADELKIEDNIIDKINILYNPLAHCFDKPMQFDIDTSSLIYTNSSVELKKNSNNAYSQMYSRQRVRDIFEKTILENNIEYEYVVTSRFDFLNTITIQLCDLEKNHLYGWHQNHSGRYHVGDNFFITDPAIFLKLSNIYSNLPNLINNTDLDEIMKKNGEKHMINAEELITTNYLYYFNTIENVIRSDKIPYFMKYGLL